MCQEDNKMLAANILTELPLTPEELEEYNAYHAVIGADCAVIAQAYMQKQANFDESREKFKALACETVPECAVNLLFLLECSGFLLECYDEAGIAHDVFWDTMRDMRWKMNECRRLTGHLGILPIGWYPGFLDVKRFALGRLQYDDTTFSREPCTVCGYSLREGDFVLSCHIPSSGPLPPERCIDSFKRAYAFFSDRLREDGILPIVCGSWLLYPPYLPLFGDNTRDFVRNFHIASTKVTETFNDAWRVFGKYYEGSTEGFPTDTSLQRRFVDYIKRGGSFGTGFGILLFDGERVLTRQ